MKNDSDIIKKFKELNIKYEENMSRLKETEDQEQKIKQLLGLREQILNSVEEGIIGIDTQGNHTYINSAAAKMLGYKPEELIGKNTHSAWHHSRADGSVHPTEECPIYASIKNSMPTKLTEDVFWNKDGKPIPVQYQTIPIIEKGVSEGTVLVFKNLTEYNKLINQVAFQSELLDSSMDSVILIDISGKIVYANQYACKIYEYRRDEFVGGNINKILFKKLSPEEILNYNIEYLNDKECVIETKHVSRSGREFEVEVKIKAIEHNGKTLILGINRDITERKKTERELLESEAKFKGFVENSNDAIWNLDKNGKFIWANKKAQEISGYTIEEMKGKSFVPIVFSEDVPKVIKAFKSLIAGNAQNYETRLLTKSGKIIYLLINSNPVYKNNKLIGTIGFGKDITDRKSTEIALQESEARYRGLVEMLSDGVIVNTAGKIVFVNQAALRIIGVNNLGEILNKEIQEFFQSSQNNCTVNPDENSEAKLQTQLYKEGTLTKADKTVIYIESSSIPMIYEDKPSCLIFFRDITRRKESEEMNKLNEMRLEGLLTLSKQYQKSISELYTYALEEAVKLTGSEYGIIYFVKNIPETPSKIYSGKVTGDCTLSTDLISPVKNKMLLWRQFFDIKEPVIINDFKQSSKLHKLMPPGHVRINRLLMVPVFIENQLIAIVRIANKDKEYTTSDSRQVMLIIDTVLMYSERKRAENELLVAKERAEESDRLKTAFLNNVSHEIRTPMNSILGFSNLLDDPELTFENRKKYAEFIKMSSNQLLSIISDIIRISSIHTKPEKVVIREFNLNETLNYLYQQFKLKQMNKEVQFSVSTSLKDDFSIIKTDETKLNQILTNLIGNALKFTNEGKVGFGYNIKGSYIEFYVKDTGIGIEKEAHERVFDRFSQANKDISVSYGGTGLGLAISKAYVELLGGKIWLESKPGKGSVFYFTIPYEKSETAVKTQNKGLDEKLKSVLNNKTILIAEDVEQNFLLLKEIFRYCNVKIIRAENGEEAVRLCRVNPEISLVLMDINMPVMDGYEATSIIKKINSDLPVVALTAFANEAETNSYTGKGFSEFLLKPIDRNILFEIIIKILNPDR